jgi:hypothetical protein
VSRDSRERHRVELEMYREIDAVYAGLPTVECKGLCHEYCTEILMSSAEEYRLNHESGRPYEFVKKFRQLAYGLRTPELCPHLSADKRCTVYAIRPAVCRAFGVGEGLPCPFGCQPTRTLTKSEAGPMFFALNAIGGKYLPKLVKPDLEV